MVWASRGWKDVVDAAEWGRVGCVELLNSYSL